MKIYIHTHIGTRENNEDALGLIDNAFIVCDGVGGADKGEVASNFIVSETLNDIKDPLFILSKVNLQDLLENVQYKLNKKLKENNGAEGMGTTFCGVFIDDSGIYTAHIGDSRIYLIKPKSKNVWHTWDHSIVGELLKSEQINREEARLHPMGNRISRAIAANKDQLTSTAEIHKISKVDETDIFFICSDGVNEAWNEFELVTLLCNTEYSLQQKGDLIARQCDQKSKDNNTFLILEFEEEDSINQGDNDEIEFLKLIDLK